MDDMKKLVEKYKRELMEYSRRAATNPPAQRLEFPEMTDELEEQPMAADEDIAYQPVQREQSTTESQEQTASEALQERADEPRKPQIISYGVDGAADVFDNVFGKFTQDDGVSTVTPEIAERLDDIPESGENPDEQLGRRDFEEQTETVNSPKDIKPLQQQGEAPAAPPEREYATLEEFVEANNRRGTARFRTYTARGALPVKGAKIVVSREIGGKQHIFYTLTTDESGQTPIISLPAPPKELSEAPESAVLPYATYNAQVTADGFDEVLINSIPIFEGVQSVQRVALVPEMGQPPEIVENTEPSFYGGV